MQSYAIKLKNALLTLSFLYIFTHYTHITFPPSSHHSIHHPHKRKKRVCHKSMAHSFRFFSFSGYGTEKIVFIYNKAQTFTSSGFAFPKKICIFAENFFKYGKDTNKI